VQLAVEAQHERDCTRDTQHLLTRPRNDARDCVRCERLRTRVRVCMRVLCTFMCLCVHVCVHVRVFGWVGGWASLWTMPGNVARELRPENPYAATSASQIVILPAPCPAFRVEGFNGEG